MASRIRIVAVVDVGVVVVVVGVVAVVVVVVVVVCTSRPLVHTQPPVHLSMHSCPCHPICVLPGVLQA